MTIEKLHSLFITCKEACTDTRNITKDCMFFALKGNNFNGNTFALEALSKGAKFAVVDEKLEEENENIIVVNDVLKVLQKLATYHRKSLNIPVIALTGSNGKTTTKELIAAVLNTSFSTTATLGNLNNHIGVPLTILRFNKNTEIGIVEMGANHQKEIEFLSQITLPDYGLITNFGKAHLEGFGGVKGVIKGKSELYDHLKKNQKHIFYNLDDQEQVKQIGEYKNTINFCSSNKKSKGLIIKKRRSNNEYVNVAFKDQNIESKLIGDYNLNNIAYAITIGNYFKIPSEKIKTAIESYVPKNNRSQIINKGNNKIILDAYNANPSSMKAALDNFKTVKSLSKMTILGDMFELGKDAEKEHQYIVNYSEQLNEGISIFIGENFYSTTVAKSTTQKFCELDDFKAFLVKNPIKNSIILIKGSRGMALERVLDFL